MFDMMMGSLFVVGAVCFFGFFAFYAWLDYRKKKDERDATHQERMKALELGFAPQDAEVARANAYATAARAMGLIGLLVPIAVLVLTVIGTIVAVIYRPGENIAAPLLGAWSIAACIVLFTIIWALGAIRQFPRPGGDGLPRGAGRDRRPDPASAEIQEKRLEL